MLSIIVKGYRLCFTNPPLLHKTSISPGAQRGTGNARANIPDASKECNSRVASDYSRILFKCIPGTQSVRRVASSDISDLK